MQGSWHNSLRNRFKRGRPASCSDQPCVAAKKATFSVATSGRKKIALTKPNDIGQLCQETRPMSLLMRKKSEDSIIKINYIFINQAVNEPDIAARKCLIESLDFEFAGERREAIVKDLLLRTAIHRRQLLSENVSVAQIIRVYRILTVDKYVSMFLCSNCHKSHFATVYSFYQNFTFNVE